MSVFNLIDEDVLVDIYNDIDRNTVKNIYELQENRSDTRYEFTVKVKSAGDKLVPADFNSKAEFIHFSDNERYAKFYVPLNIFNNEDIKDLQKTAIKPRNFSLDVKDIEKNLQTVYERGIKNRDTIDVYVNGEKLPDKSVLITVYQGKVDVYFNSNIFEEGENEVSFLLRKNSAKRPYVNYTWFGEANLNGYNINHRDFSLYQNGIYLVKDLDYFVLDGNITITNDVYEDDVMELVYEYGTIYKSGYVFTPYSNIIDVHNLQGLKEVLDTKTQPITKRNLYVYKNGYRICSDDITELNGSFFQLDGYTINDEDEIYIVVKLEYLGNEKDNLFYSDNYSKINNLYNLNLIHRHLIGKNQNMSYIFPKNFTVDNMRLNYPPFYINNLIKNPILLSKSRRDFSTQSIETYIKSNSSYIYNFARAFNQPENVVFEERVTPSNISLYLTKDTSGLPEYYYTTFDKPRFLIIYRYKDENIAEKIFVNNKLLSRECYEVINVREYKCMYYFVRTDYLEEICDIKMVVETGPTNHVLHKIIEVEEDQYIYDIDMEAISMSKLRYDLVRLFTSKDRRMIYLEEDKDYRIFIEGTDIKLEIINKDLIGMNVVYFNPFFVYRSDLKVCKTLLDSTSRVISIHDIVPNKYFSYMCENSNNVEIYYDGYRLINGIDFVIIRSTFYNSVEDNRILLNIDLKENKFLSFVFKNRREDTMITKDSINSEYGLLYLNELQIPVNLKYMDLYLDNERLTNSEVEIHSDNLFQIKNKNYLKYFGLISNVDLPAPLLKYFDYLKQFNKDSFEDFFSKLLGQESDIDTVYEKIKDFSTELKVESIDKEPNIPKHDLRFDHLYENFLLGLIDKKIDCNKGIKQMDIENRELFNYFPSDILPLNANKKLLKYEATLDTSEFCYTRIAIAELFGSELHLTKENNDGEIDNIYVHPIYKYIYEENEITLNANNEAYNMYECDANEEEEIIVFGSDEYN